MDLTKLEAKLLAAMESLEPQVSLSVRQLIAQTGNEYSGGSIRRALRGLSCRSLAIRSDQSPVRWRISELGHTAIHGTQYQDYLQARAV